MLYDMIRLIFGEIPTDDKNKEGVKKEEPIEKKQEPVIETIVEKPNIPEKVYPEDYVKELREENKKKRLELVELKRQVVEKERLEKEKEKQADLAKLTEVEALKKQKEEAEKQAQQAIEIANMVVKESAVIEEASKLGFQNPKLAVKLINEQLSGIEIQDGAIKDRDAIIDSLTELLEKEPYLKRQEAAPTVKRTSQIEPVGVKNQADKASDLDTQIKDAIKRGDGQSAFRLFWQKSGIR